MHRRPWIPRTNGGATVRCETGSARKGGSNCPGVAFFLPIFPEFAGVLPRTDALEDVGPRHAARLPPSPTALDSSRTTRRGTALGDRTATAWSHRRRSAQDRRPLSGGRLQRLGAAPFFRAHCGRRLRRRLRAASQEIMRPANPHRGRRPLPQDFRAMPL
jgi:hypothetical protein